MIFFFFFNDAAPTEIYTLSLHDALPISQWFNTAAFALPPIGTFGNAGNGIIRGPGINNWDFALYKNIPIREIGRAHAELQSPCNLVCRLLLEKKNDSYGYYATRRRTSPT